jgi:hypothetical protein
MKNKLFEISALCRFLKLHDLREQYLSSAWIVLIWIVLIWSEEDNHGILLIEKINYCNIFYFNFPEKTPLFPAPKSGLVIIKMSRRPCCRKGLLVIKLK